jgi:hypothetical protein
VLGSGAPGQRVRNRAETAFLTHFHLHNLGTAMGKTLPHGTGINSVTGIARAPPGAGKACLWSQSDRCRHSCQSGPVQYLQTVTITSNTSSAAVGALLPAWRAGRNTLQPRRFNFYHPRQPAMAMTACTYDRAQKFFPAWRRRVPSPRGFSYSRQNGPVLPGCRPACTISPALPEESHSRPFSNPAMALPLRRARPSRFNQPVAEQGFDPAPQIWRNP